MELLRIVAMIMVVMLHYLNKGEVVVSLVEDRSADNLLFWFLNALCIVTTNVYVLISGYFLLEAKWKLSRLGQLWCQVMFYSLGVPLLCFALGIGEVRQWGLYDWINVLFPIQMEHYWFLTAYVVLYLLVPVLGVGVKHMDKKLHGGVVLGLLMVFSIPKSLIPVPIPTDRYGYDFGWFVCLFLMASYIRKYGISFFDRGRKALRVYLFLTVLLWGLALLYGGLTAKGLPLSYACDMVYCYNHILVFMASVAFFYVFYYIRIPQGRIARLICRISPYALGVYLLHENLALKDQWQAWAGIRKVKEGVLVWPHMLLTVAAIFIAGVAVDFVRECCFQFVIRGWKKIFAKRNAK